MMHRFTAILISVLGLQAPVWAHNNGFVEAIDDSTLLAIAARQPDISGGRIHGEAIEVQLLEAAGQSRVGRFGWKDQHSSLLSFVADAYLNEMGVTNRLRAKDVTAVGKVTPDPEDVPDDLGLADIDHFAQFIRGTKAPPRDTAKRVVKARSRDAHAFREVAHRRCLVAACPEAANGRIEDDLLIKLPESRDLRRSRSTPSTSASCHFLQSA
jgi:hypothetical protein